MSVVLRQTWAMMVDAYRELAAGRLFWITLALSGLVVGIFACLGIDEEGVKFLWFRLGFLPMTSEDFPPDLLYKQMFLSFGVPLWLGWVATILALVSTAGVIPNFIAGGAIDLSLAKPIGRVRLFLTRYLSGLAFVGLQVGAFSFASFLLIGIRGGDWQPRVLLALPVVLVFFSYLFCVCAFLGLVTRSSIASLLLTALFWVMLIILNRGDETLMAIKVQSELVAEQRAVRVQNAELMAENRLARMKETGEELPPREEWGPGIETELEAANPLLPALREQQTRGEKSSRSLAKWSTAVRAVKFPLPKTIETLQLMDRMLLSKEDYERLMKTGEGEQMDTPFGQDEKIDQREYARRVTQAQLKRSPAVILGTSLGFEAVVLAVCCFIFARRDF